MAEQRPAPTQGCRGRMEGYASTVFSGKSRGMSLMGFLTFMMISGVVHSPTILPPLAQPPLWPLTLGNASRRVAPGIGRAGALSRANVDRWALLNNGVR